MLGKVDGKVLGSSAGMEECEGGMDGKIVESGAEDSEPTTISQSTSKFSSRALLVC
jgi:hypothetical protein